jgi:hypothetical protein
MNGTRCEATSSASFIVENSVSCRRTTPISRKIAPKRKSFCVGSVSSTSPSMFPSKAA